MRVLVGCETSGKVREAFRALGHDAWSCDLLPADDGSEFHLQKDVRDVIGCRGLYSMGPQNPFHWDLGIFHPPCTRLCNSGVRWLHERNLWDELQEGADLFAACLHAPIPRVAVENPVMHRHAKERIRGYVEFTQSIQPWQFGHGEVKRTCLWLRNLPPLVPTQIVEGREARIHKASPGKDRWKLRSETYQGIADAMAQQWGNLASGQAADE
jgi:hypothetical protein